MWLMWLLLLLLLLMIKKYPGHQGSYNFLDNIFAIERLHLALLCLFYIPKRYSLYGYCYAYVCCQYICVLCYNLF